MAREETAVFGFRIEKSKLDEFKKIAFKEHMPMSVLARRWIIRAMEDYIKKVRSE